MRARMWLALSVVLNLALALGLGWEMKSAPPQTAQVAPVAFTNVIVSSNKTNIVVRRQFFNWSELESDDYPTFVANLRRIGCPEITVRDIIIADVNQAFAQRRATEVTSAESQWWKSEPDMNQTEIALKKMQEIDTERVALLTKLLGPNWNVNFTQPSERGTVTLDGSILGKIEPDTKLKVQELAANATRRASEYVDAQRAAGKKIDPLELAKIRSEHRAELAKVLTAEQLEEYLLRYSANAESLRDQLRGFGATPDEFRSIFRARDAVDNDIQLHYTGTDANTEKTRANMEKMRDAAVEQTLGPERAALYRATADPLFREAQFLAQQSGAAPEKVLPLYQVQVEGARERARIQGDKSMTQAERAAAIRIVADQEEAARRKILGLPPEDEPTQ